MNLEGLSLSPQVGAGRGTQVIAPNEAARFIIPSFLPILRSLYPTFHDSVVFPSFFISGEVHVCPLEMRCSVSAQWLLLSHLDKGPGTSAGSCCGPR